MSCDLPSDASADCNRDSFGNAFQDLCGSCVGGNTGLEEGYLKNHCGKCGGSPTEACEDCGLSTAINYNENATADPGACTVDGEWVEGCFERDDERCVDNMCTDYLPASKTKDSDGNIDENEYSCGENNEISCNIAEEMYSMCYPQNCNTQFKIADFYGKAIFIEMTASW